MHKQKRKKTSKEVCNEGKKITNSKEEHQERKVAGKCASKNDTSNKEHEHARNQIINNSGKWGRKQGTRNNVQER